MMRFFEVELHTTLAGYLAVLAVACVCALFCGLMLGSAWGTTEIKRTVCDHGDPGDNGDGDDDPEPDSDPDPDGDTADLYGETDLRPEFVPSLPAQRGPLGLPVLSLSPATRPADRFTFPKLRSRGRHSRADGRVPCSQTLEVARARATAQTAMTKKVECVNG